MDCIKLSFGVDLKSPVIRTLSNKDNGRLLYPYENVLITIHVEYTCPFCGKAVREFRCKCEAFNRALQKLQESYGDEQHKSCCHGPELNIQSGIFKSISDFTVQTLTKKEVLELGLDLWDYAIHHTDRLSDRSYLVTPAKQYGDNIYIICKDLTSKKVYRFETSIPEYKDKPIYLGIQRQKTVSNGRRTLGNYYFKYYWVNLVTFEDWNDVCNALNNV